MGLHDRYARLLTDMPEVFMAGRKEREDEIRKQLSVLFDGMMRAAYNNAGAQLSVEILADPQVREFIDAHAAVLDSSFERTPMSEALRRSLQRSDFIFSGMKTFHELNEAFPSMLDDNGARKPFERFLNDVRSIDRTYNSNYLRAEYNFVSASAEMAAKWEEFERDGDRYNLQYRTQKDDRVRPQHAALDGVTLPPSDSFWTEFFPPNGWNCRCTVVQVRKSKYPATDHDEAMSLGDAALQKDTKGMFRFNPGIEQSTVPDYNPYTLSRCRSCEVPKNKDLLSRVAPPDNEVCAACRFLHGCEHTAGCRFDKEFGKRLRISDSADQTELEDNIRVAKALLKSFPDMNIKIREHILAEGHKNPEYLIDELIADRKGVESEKGITAGFRKAITQKCSAVVIDLDMHMNNKPLRTIKLAQYIDGRKRDFSNGVIKECYVVYQGNAVRVTSWSSRQDLTAQLEKLRP